MRVAPMTRPETERIAALEVQVAALNKQLEETHRTVQELRDVLMQAKGARWAIWGLIGLAGLVGGLVGKFAPFLSR